MNETKFNLEQMYHFSTGHYPKYDLEAYYKWVEEQYLSLRKDVVDLLCTIHTKL
jgi:hypothetical protein